MINFSFNECTKFYCLLRVIEMLQGFLLVVVALLVKVISNTLGITVDGVVLWHTPKELLT